MAGVNSLRGVLSYLQVRIKEDDRSSRTYTPNVRSFPPFFFPSTT